MIGAILSLSGALVRAALVGGVLLLPALTLPGISPEALVVVLLVAGAASLVVLLEYSAAAPGLIEFCSAPPYNRIRFVALVAMVSSCLSLLGETLSRAELMQLTYAPAESAAPELRQFSRLKLDPGGLPPPARAGAADQPEVSPVTTHSKGQQSGAADMAVTTQSGFRPTELGALAEESDPASLFRSGAAATESTERAKPRGSSRLAQIGLQFAQIGGRANPLSLSSYLLPGHIDAQGEEAYSAAVGLCFLISTLALTLFVLLQRYTLWPRVRGSFDVWRNLPSLEPTAGGDLVVKLHRTAVANIVIGLSMIVLLPIALEALRGQGLSALSDAHGLVWATVLWAFLPLSLVMRGIALDRLSRMIALQRSLAPQGGASAAA